MLPHRSFGGQIYRDSEVTNRHGESVGLKKEQKRYHRNWGESTVREAEPIYLHGYRLGEETKEQNEPRLVQPFRIKIGLSFFLLQH